MSGRTDRGRLKAGSLWPNTGLTGSAETWECSTLVHVTDLDNALAIVKQGRIKPHPEQDSDNALYCKPVKVVWFSPREYDDCVFGCVAFRFSWSTIRKYHGKNIYFLDEVKGRGKGGRQNWKSQILFSRTAREEDSWVKYDPAAEGGPWAVRNDCNYIRSDCDCQIGVATEVSLRDLHSIRFVNHKPMGGDGQELRAYCQWAEHVILCRCVADGLRPIKGFCEVNPETDKVSDALLKAWTGLWSNIWKSDNFECRGTVKVEDDVAESLARAFLDRHAKSHHGMKPHTSIEDDDRRIASLFRSPKNLILSLRRVIATWAGVKEECLDSTKWGWPPRGHG